MVPESSGIEVRFGIKAPGKLILLGEYAVLEGAPALVCAVDRFAEVHIKKMGESYYSVSAPNLKIPETPFNLSDKGILQFIGVDQDIQRQLAFFRVIFEYIIHYFQTSGIIPKPVGITLDTGSFYSESLKTKLGFGSSAAMTVALTRALMEAYAKTELTTRARIFRLALSAHRHAQGNLGSGVDIAASAFGGVLIYELGFNNRAEQREPEPLEVWDELSMVTIFSGKSESTRKMVKGVGQLKKSHPELYNRVLKDLGNLSVIGCECYRNRRLEEFLQTISEYQASLRVLGEKSGMPIISDVHLTLAQLVEGCGGFYKPSGAGSGDIGIAFTQNSAALERIRNVVHQSGYRTVDVSVVPGQSQPGFDG